ncbi:MAG: acyltransferase family protein [Pseudomonadota bacterium]
MNARPDSLPTQRRHDLDWLRVIAFGILIGYHIGMLYVARWGFHYKSAYTSTFLENIMLFANPWRMALLWMISGIATSYLLDKLRWWDFLGSRTVRLLLPLAFGVWVIVPPQLFVEMSGKGDFAGTYLEFYRAFFDFQSPVFAEYQSGIWPHVDVNHLWYLRELWTFTLLLLIALPLLNWLRESPWLLRLLTPFGTASVLFAAPLILVGIELAVFPEFGSEGRRKALGLSFFLLGYLVTKQEPLWEALRRVRWAAAALGLAAYGLTLAAYHLVWLPATSDPAGMQLSGLVALNHAMRWWCLCALFGFALQHLNRPSRLLSYLSPGVYPFYIVHQTLILLLAFYLAPLSLGPVLEPGIVVFGTIGGCLLIYEVARRIALLRPLLGLKWWSSAEAAQNASAWQRRVLAGLAAVIVVPLGLEILL